MVINSKFKDYYDSIAHQYRDPKVVYNRVHEFKKLSDFNSDFKNFAYDYSWGPILSSLFSKHHNRQDDGECNLLLIGGKVYPSTYKKENGGLDRKYNSDVWDFKNTYDFLDEYLKSQTKYAKGFYSRKKKISSGERIDKAVKFNQVIAPIILIWGDKRKFGGSCVELNPRLNHYKPNVSPWEIVQDIMGVLDSVEPHIPEMDNQNKIDSHGYDEYSFRPKMKKR